MRLIGFLATAAGLAVMAGAAAVVVQSLPDIQRYVKIRSM
jgi:hypothetical protein